MKVSFVVDAPLTAIVAVKTVLWWKIAGNSRITGFGRSDDFHCVASVDTGDSRRLCSGP